MDSNQENNAISGFRNWVRTSVTLKLISIGFIILLLLIPLGLIQDLVRERSTRHYEVREEISRDFGGEQFLDGVVLSVPFSRVIRQVDANRNVVAVTNQPSVMTFYPSSLDIHCELKPDSRKRGIYEVAVFGADATLKGDFEMPDSSDFTNEEITIDWSGAYVSLMIEDLAHISGIPSLVWNGRELSFEPGATETGGSGLICPVVLDPASLQTLPFEAKLSFNGSHSLQFSPLAREQLVSVSSTWPDPKFNGAFLPTERDISDGGFTANWKVLHLNRPLSQAFEGKPYSQSTYDYRYGVNLFIPIDHYAQSDRSVKYAAMLIAFTFALFFLVQMIRKIQIHPMHFLLVGLALCVFYTLLISISEHLYFGKAYLVAASAVVLLISAYFQASFRRRSLTALTFGVLSALYLYIYVILQMEDYALLMGSIGLFVALALVMYASRNLDWSNLKNNARQAM